MSVPPIRIATRKSQLALWQANWVRGLLEARAPERGVELVPMVTQGDRVLDRPLAEIGGKGLFIKELEQGMLNGLADAAVHSLKDLPAELPEGLTLAVVLPRADPRDAFVSRDYARLADLPAGARIGTSSQRRQFQLRALRPDLDWRPLRGNVDTRLAKLDRGEYDAIILAAAGLTRLGFQARIREVLDPSVCLPAIGQGAVGIECRADDRALHAVLAGLHDEETALCVRAERAVSARLDASCDLPLAGFAELDGGTLTIRAALGLPDGSAVARAEYTGPAADPEAVGAACAERLLDAGGAAILQQLR